MKRKKYKKRLVSGLSAAAACLVLTVGLVQSDVLDFMGAAAEGSFNGAAVESVTENEAPSNSSMEKVDDSAAETRDTVTPGAAPGQAVPPKDIYDMVTDENDSELAYYCLPCFTIEERGDGEASVMHGCGIDAVNKVQVWLDELMEKGQALDRTRLEMIDMISLEISYVVTIEQEPQHQEIYYLIGEVGWYE